MLPTDKNHACQSVLQDVLSSLPENVIDDILIRLPLRDAVRTNVLSTKWRYKWCRIPELKLVETLWETTTDRISLTTKFTNIIYHLLAFHAGPITKFKLSICNFGDCPEIDKLIYFLSRNGVQHLDLSFSLDNRCELPSSIFTCSQLRHLFLSGCSIQIAPSAFKGFDRLISLELFGVTISSKILESLISNCPLIEQLGLYHNLYSDVIHINAPMLRSFGFIEDTGSICLNNVPQLSSLSFTLVEPRVRTTICDIAKFFESFPALEHLQLNDLCLKFLAAGARELPTRLPFDLNCLKRLCLVDIFLGELDVVSCILCLIRSFPYLQYLEFQAMNTGDDEGDDVLALECLEVEASSYMAFNHLREVKLTSIIGLKPEMQLIKLLLVKSPVLVRMLIKSRLVEGSAKVRKLALELTKFQLASPKAEVVVQCYNPDCWIFDSL